MPFSKEQLKIARTNRKKLVQLIIKRKKLEQNWLVNKERIYEPTTMYFKDLDGLTLLDYSIVLSDIEVIKKYFNDKVTLSPRTQALARIAGNEKVLNLLKIAPGKSIISHNIDTHSNSNIIISQSYLIHKLKHYQKLQNQDPKVLGDKGCCGGFNFLKLYYSSIGRGEEFFKILACLSTWDGNYDTLYGKLKDAENFSTDYKNLHDVFRQLANDLIWFQETYLDKTLKSLNPGYANRKLQYQFVKSVKDDTSLTFDIDMSLLTQKITAAQLAEYLRLLTHSANASFEIIFQHHATSVYVKKPTHLDFYNSNEKHRMEPFSCTTKLALYIQNTYHQMDQSQDKSDKSMSIKFRSYKQNIPENELRYFSKTELKNFGSEESILKYQKNSPNKLTPLHIAVFNNSIEDVIELLNKPLYGGLNQKDAHHCTPIDLAMDLGKLNILEILLNSQYFDVNQHQILARAYWHLGSNTIAKPLFDICFARKLTHTNGLLNAATYRGDTSMIEQLLKRNISPMEEGALPLLKSSYALFTAIDMCAKNGVHPLKLLLKHQRNLDITNEHGVTLLQYAQNLNMVRAIEVINKEKMARFGDMNRLKLFAPYEECGDSSNPTSNLTSYDSV